MGKPGRPPLVNQTGGWKLRIPLKIQAQVDLLLLDPVRGKARHGSRSRLVTLLLEAWLAGKVEIPDLFGFDLDEEVDENG